MPTSPGTLRSGLNPGALEEKRMPQEGWKLTSRFGGAWTALSAPDADGWLMARREEDGVERTVHMSDFASWAPPKEEAGS